MIRRGDDVARGHVGRGVRGDRPAARRDPRRARQRRGRGVPREPERAQPRRRCSTTACCCRRSARANIYSASTVDQMPKQVSAGLMFGAALIGAGARRRSHRLPPDARCEPVRVERQPAGPRPTCPARLRALRARGGRLVVVDPRRTKTAEEADEHVAIRPGTDALVPLRASCTCCSPRTSSISARSPTHVDGRRRGAQRSRPTSRPSASRRCTRHRRRDDPPHRPRARRGAARPRCTARIGTCTQEFGTLASWLVDVVQRAHRQPRPAGRRDVRRSRPPASANTGGTPGHGPRRALRAPQQPRARAARVLRRAAGRRAWPRRSRRRAKVRSAR